MNTTTSIIVGLIVVIAVGGLVYWQKMNSDEQFISPTPTASTNENESETDIDDDIEKEDDDTVPSADTSSSGITMATVASHNSRTSCWTVIDGSVYDLTSWIPNHPGGEGAILGLCGTDGSAKFNGQHGGGQRQLSILAGFKIGVLTQ